MKGTRPLDNDEIRRVLGCFTGTYAVRNHGLFILGMSTVARISELLSLRIGDMFQIVGFTEIDTRRDPVFGAGVAGVRSCQTPTQGLWSGLAMSGGDAVKRWVIRCENRICCRNRPVGVLGGFIFYL